MLINQFKNLQWLLIGYFTDAIHITFNSAKIIRRNSVQVWINSRASSYTMHHAYDIDLYNASCIPTMIQLLSWEKLYIKGDWEDHEPILLRCGESRAGGREWERLTVMFNKVFIVWQSATESKGSGGTIIHTLLNTICSRAQFLIPSRAK